jgi:hypothetical protein
MFPLVTVTVDPPATRQDGGIPPQEALPAPGGQPISLAELRGLRSAPELGEPQRLQLRRELELAITPYSWFTLGVMAADVETAISVLRRVESALGWTGLQPAPNTASPVLAQLATAQEAQVPLQRPVDGANVDPQAMASDPTFSDPMDVPLAHSPGQALPVFLKGNQRTGLFHIRPEAGLGVGLLITGQEGQTTMGSETWGPLPLDLFD